MTNWSWHCDKPQAYSSCSAWSFINFAYMMLKHRGSVNVHWRLSYINIFRSITVWVPKWDLGSYKRLQLCNSWCVLMCASENLHLQSSALPSFPNYQVLSGNIATFHGFLCDIWHVSVYVYLGLTLWGQGEVVVLHLVTHQQWSA